jgi:hypothetical protein
MVGMPFRPGQEEKLDVQEKKGDEEEGGHTGHNRAVVVGKQRVGAVSPQRVSSCMQWVHAKP